MTARPRNLPGGTSALKPPVRPPLAAPPRDTSAPAAPAPAPAPAADVAPVMPSPAPVVDDVPPPPPGRQRHTREQFNSKIRVDLRRRLSEFVEQHESTLQGVLEAALDEYMARRGWSWDDYHHEHRRR